MTLITDTNQSSKLISHMTLEEQRSNSLCTVFWYFFCIQWCL